MKLTTLFAVLTTLSATSAAPLPSGRSNPTANATRNPNSPPPCGRFIGEMWFPMRRRPDGTCPPSPGYSRPRRKKTGALIAARAINVQDVDGEGRSGAEDAGTDGAK